MYRKLAKKLKTKMKIYVNPGLPSSCFEQPGPGLFLESKQGRILDYQSHLSLLAGGARDKGGYGDTDSYPVAPEVI